MDKQGICPAEQRQESEEKEIELLAEGRRAMACKEFMTASMAFQEACEIMVAKHGQVADLLAEPYFLYGKSLLELARHESSVLGEGVPVPQDKSDSDEEEEDEDEDEQEEDDEEEGAGEANDTSSATPVGASSDTKSAVGEADTGKTGDGEEEEPGNLQVAWEVLEVSRVIYQKSQTQEAQLKLAEVSLLLGEVSLESDQYDKAVEDFTTCLKLREAWLPPDDRRLAEIHFQLGLAHTLAKTFDEAVEEYCAAKCVLEIRKEMLQNQLDKMTDETEKSTLQREITELSDIFPDIDSKINDVEETKKVTQINKEEEGAAPDTTTGLAPSFVSENVSEISVHKSPKTDEKITDISHLVRKKPQKMNGDNQALVVDSTSSDNQLKRKRVAEEAVEGELTAKKSHTPPDSVSCPVEQ